MGLFNRSNKKSEREQKIKELVGGTLMSDSFKKKLESHGIKAVGLTSKGVELQRAFKLKIKEETIPTEQLEIKLEEFILEYIDNPNVLSEKYKPSYYSDNKQILKKNNITGLNEQGEFISFFEKTKNKDINKDKITEEDIHEYHQSVEQYNKHLIDFEEQIKKLNVEELKKLKKETDDDIEKNIIKDRIKMKEIFEKLPVSENEIEYIQEITLHETRNNHVFRDREEELLKGIIALTKDRVILRKISYTRGKDRGIKTILYKNITGVDYDKGSRFGNDSIEITVSGAEVLIIQSFSCENLYNYLNEKVNKAHLQSESGSSVQTNNNVADLEKIVSLYEKGLLTDEEFKSMKKKLIQ